MALRTLAPRLSTLPHKSQTLKTTTGANRDATTHWRAWYKTARWQRLRRECLLRDLYTCQQTGELLIGGAHAPNSPVADHIIPHRGDPALFWDAGNIQTVSKRYHDSEKARIENAAERLI